MLNSPPLVANDEWRKVADLHQQGTFIKSQIISFIEIILPYSISLKKVSAYKNRNNN
jgi:hypothetical protein